MHISTPRIRAPIATYETLHASATTNPHIHTTLTIKAQVSQLLQFADPRQLFRAFRAEVIRYTTCTQHTLTIHITAHMHYKYTFAHSALTGTYTHYCIIHYCIYIHCNILCTYLRRVFVHIQCHIRDPPCICNYKSPHSYYTYRQGATQSVAAVCRSTTTLSRLQGRTYSLHNVHTTHI